MLQHINKLNTIQNYPIPQMNTTFKANPVGKIKALERTPVTDVVTRSSKNKAFKPLLAFGTFLLSGFGSCNRIKHLIHKRKIQAIEKKYLELQADMPRVMKTFKDVFLREDLTEKEALEILNRYREIEILGITGKKKEYIKALFQEAKQNYGFKDSPIQLIMKVPQRKKLRGTCHGLNHRIMINPKYDNSDIFNTMHHEFRHAKQQELAYNIDPTTVDNFFLMTVEKLKPTFYNIVKSTIIDNGISGDQELQKKLIEYFSCDYDKIVTRYLGKPSINNIPKSQQEFAQRLVKSFKDCKYNEYSKYGEYSKNRFFEQDARFAGESIAKLFGLMAR